MSDKPSPFEADIKKTEELLKLMDDMWDDLPNPPLKLKNEDGSVNYHNIIRLLNGEEFSEYRAKNPAVFAQAKVNSAVEIGAGFLQAGYDLGKLGFAINQVNQAKKINVKETQTPRTLRKNPSLRRAMSQAYGRANSGLTTTEKELQRQEAEEIYEKGKSNIVSASGGQSAQVVGGIQGLVNQRRKNSLRTQALNQQAQRRNRGDYNRLAMADAAEDARINQSQQQQFRNQEGQRKIRLAQQERLRRAGLLNTFSAGQSILNDLGHVAQRFQGDLPGQVYENSMYDPNIDHTNPLSNVFHNPAADPRIGGSHMFMDPAQYEPNTGDGNVIPSDAQFTPNAKGLPPNTYLPQDEEVFRGQQIVLNSGPGRGYNYR